MIADVKKERLWYNNSTDRVTIKLYSLPCTKDTTEQATVFMSFMRAILDDPAVLGNGTWWPFESAEISHDGKCWVLKAVSFLKKEVAK